MISLFGEMSPLLILAIIAGLVEFAKKLGVTGNGSLIMSLVLGVVFGIIFQLMELFPVISPWVQVVFFGLLFGLAASGLYDLGKKFTGTIDIRG
jgi:hypothetical protein